MKHRKLLTVFEIAVICIAGAGFFPIINFNPDNPVDLGIYMNLFIVALSCVLFTQLGRLEIKLFPEWTMVKVLCVNAGVAAASLVLRYLIEFGEVSNTYNFTAANIIFHVVFAIGFATAAWFAGKKRAGESNTK